MATQKDPITCHVLDTTAGRPATNVAVRLEGPETTAAAAAGQANAHRYEAVTDADGRVTRWQPAAGETTALADVLATSGGGGGGGATSRWRLTFDTEAYFGEGRTFFPEAVVVFRVQEGQHYHVPLLLSPFTFTTYRGS